MARRPLRMKSKIWLESGGRMIFSDGRLQLLEAVEELGSLRQRPRAA
jgi:molybdenum-dependent DNA-binding transcriptional regulator ModE